MPAALQALSTAELAYLGMVVAAFVVFWVCLFAVWTYVSLGGEPKTRKVEIMPAVRPSEGVGSSDDLQHAA